jgi:diguanylate cyclase (GGDEF)-like protein
MTFEIPTPGTAGPTDRVNATAVRAAGAFAPDSKERVRFEILNRALAASQAQYRAAQARIQSLAQRNSKLERDLVVLARREEQARRLAYHDALTGLANRALLQDRLRQSLAQAQRACQQVALLLIDLDGFKRINDTLGHGAGDRLLQAVAARLSASIREADTACRHGGDEFVIMLPGVDDAAMVDAVVDKVRARLSEPHVIDGHEIRITASVGAALYPAHGASYEPLMSHADAAMYLAKAASGPAGIQALLELPRPTVEAGSAEAAGFSLHETPARP